MASSIIYDFLQIKSFVFRLHDKYGIVDDRKNYTKAIRTFQNILKDTSKRLEATYYDYILSPQINTVHSKYREGVVGIASIVLILYLTSTRPLIGSEAFLVREDL